MTESFYYLSLQELYMLVEKSGREALFGFSDDSASNPDGQALVFSMCRMIRKGLLQSNGNALVLKDSLKRIIRSIALAQRCLVFRFSDPCRSAICCYIGQTVVVAEQSKTTSTSEVRLSEIEKDDFVLVCDSWLSDPRMEISYKDDASVDSDAQQYLLQKGLELSQPAVTALDEVLWTVDCYETDSGHLQYRSILLDEGLQISLLMLSNNQSESILFSKENLAKYIEKWMTGDPIA